jgi:hypothetical protein
VAEDIRNGNPDQSGLEALRRALIAECRDEEGNCLYTSTTFFIWLRWIKFFRGVLWAIGAIGSVIAASHILKGDADQYRIVIAGAALAGVVCPALIRTLRLDASILEYSSAAAKFKNLQAEFRRLSQIWSLKDYGEFERDAKKSFAALSEVRQGSLTPPEVCFLLARWKIKKGHYTPDASQ